MSIRRDVLVMLLVAAAFVAALIFQPGISPFARNLLVVGMFTSATGALALRTADRGAVSMLPIIGFGVVFIVLGPLFSRWIYADDFASVLRLEHPLRVARMLVHAGYSFLLVGALLPLYLAVRKPAPHSHSARADPADEQYEPRAPLQETMHTYAFTLKAAFWVSVALVAIVQVAIYLRVF